MDFDKKIMAFSALGAVFRDPSNSSLDSAIKLASRKNGWFTEENVRLAIVSLGEMLDEGKLRKWAYKYKVQNTKHEVTAKKIGVIMAGNIPLVGFHDFLCVLMSGNTFVGKLSSEDEYLLPAVAKILAGTEPGFKDRILFTDQPFNKTKDISAFIATGSNNSARYFEYYFGKYPHIIRKNRNSIALLTGNETKEELKDLGKDIFQYFGMGCRNVSKIYVPKDYNLDRFFESIVDFGEVINHNKYYNNHQYYRTIYLLNSEKFLDNNFLMLKESEQIASPVATLYYERYVSKEALMRKLNEQRENIQCIVTSSPALELRSQPSLGTRLFQEKRVTAVPFGQTQSPELWDYADGVDTMEFLLQLK